MASLQDIIDQVEVAKAFVVESQYGSSIMVVSAPKTEDHILDILNILWAVNGIEGTGEAIQRLKDYMPLINGSNSVRIEELSEVLENVLSDLGVGEIDTDLTALLADFSPEKV
jgi:hypothetical protein